MGLLLQQHCWAQQLEPRTKLLLALVVIMTLFWVPILGVGWLFLWALLAWICSGWWETPLIPRSMIVLVLVTVLAHAWWGPAPRVELFSWLQLSRAGITRGCWYAARLVVMAMVAQTLTRTTTPLAISAALQWFLWPLHRMRVLVPDLPMILAIGTRFLPELQADARRLSAVRHMRQWGEPEAGRRTLRSKVTYLTQTGKETLVPLLRLSLRRATRLGDALALRGYSPYRKPSLPRYRLRTSDVAAYVVTCGFLLLAWLSS